MPKRSVSKNSQEAESRTVFTAILLFIGFGIFWTLDLGELLLALGFYYFLAQLSFVAMGLIFGVLKGIFTRNWFALKQAWQIFMGDFRVRPNQSFLATLVDLTIRHSWELPQTFSGHAWAQSLNILGLLDRVEHFDGATFSLALKQKKRSGMSLANFIYISIDGSVEEDFRQGILKDPLFMHEYGHSFDSKLLGPFYLVLIGLPSLFSAARSKQFFGNRKAKAHKYKSYEIRANKHAAAYFEKYAVEWNTYATDFPLSN